MSKSKRRQKLVKSTIKFLASGPSDKIGREVLKSAPDGVVRAIANAALNVQQNPSVVLTPAAKNLFRSYNKSFDILTSHQHSINRKRRHLVQKGGAFPIVIPLLATALGSLGSAVISRVFNRGEE